METKLYCNDCEEPIEPDDVADHEDRGHDVRVAVRPDRLLAQDPWEHGEDEDDTEGGEDVSGDSR